MDDKAKKESMCSSHQRQGQQGGGYPSSTLYPGDHDLLLGRGGETNNHSGNINFRKMIDQYKAEYRDATKGKKPQVAQRLVTLWRSKNPPGRFLAKKEGTELWVDVGDSAAKRRTSKSLGEKGKRNSASTSVASADSGGAGDNQALAPGPSSASCASIPLALAPGNAAGTAASSAASYNSSSGKKRVRESIGMTLGDNASGYLRKDTAGASRHRGDDGSLESTSNRTTDARNSMLFSNMMFAGANPNMHPSGADHINRAMANIMRDPRNNVADVPSSSNQTFASDGPTAMTSVGQEMSANSMLSSLLSTDGARQSDRYHQPSLSLSCDFDHHQQQGLQQQDLGGETATLDQITYMQQLQQRWNHNNSGMTMEQYATNNFLRASPLGVSDGSDSSGKMMSQQELQKQQQQQQLYDQMTLGQGEIPTAAELLEDDDDLFSSDGSS